LLLLDEAEGFAAFGVPGIVRGVVVEPVALSEHVAELAIELVEGLLGGGIERSLLGFAVLDWD
jgi:hypothetical protein